MPACLLLCLPLCLSSPQARLPFFDGTLDLVHCVNSVKYLPLGEFEDLLFEWDRVLRVGGCTALRCAALPGIAWHGMAHAEQQFSSVPCFCLPIHHKQHR